MVLSFFKWMGDLEFSKGLGASVWQFATIQALHLVCLAVFAGAILIVDLRLMGRALNERPVSQVAREAQPWMIGGFLALVVTGVPQMMQNAMREYYSQFFWIKMVFLVLALIYTFTLRRKVTLADKGSVVTFQTKMVGLVSILLWAMVAIPARLIGLFS
jgi:putative copper export protein